MWRRVGVKCSRQAVEESYRIKSLVFELKVKPQVRGWGWGIKERESAVSRVLSWTAIHLRCPSPDTCSDLPGNDAGHTIVPLFGLAPGGVYLATECYHRRGALLPHHFNLTCAPERAIGGIFSAALSVGSRRPGVTWHPALWSPDFPPYS